MTADERKAWQLVLESIELELLSGRLGPGDHLPPERTLAADLGVGRSSVREAFRVLEVLGLISTQTGSGPHAGAIVIARPSGGMSALMRLQVAAQGFPVADIVNARLALESSVVAELAANARADLTFSRELLHAMDSPTASAEQFLALDARFHLALAEASGNVVVTAMMAGLRDSIERYVVAALPRIASWADTVERLRAEHHGVLHAIESNDAATASALMRIHIDGYYAESRLTHAFASIPSLGAGHALASATPSDTHES